LVKWLIFKESLFLKKLIMLIFVKLPDRYGVTGKRYEHRRQRMVDHMKQFVEWDLKNKKAVHSRKEGFYPGPSPSESVGWGLPHRLVQL
jgi:hypothetical protein